MVLLSGSYEDHLPLSQQFERLGEALADRYTLKRKVGGGGMSTVYLAEDLKHDRQVAVKVLRPELAHDLGPSRFLREIKIAARLRHPHILPLYDSGNVDGLLYYVMPYVEGDSLRDRLNREKQLAIPDALRIAQEVAEALSYAHQQGVVHRDVKPENILLSSGHAEVVDFGIARMWSAAGTEQLTQPGVAIGTPAYMSPEQASGSHELDARSDIYSLACMLYEMLAGQPPFTGPTAENVLQQHIAAPPPRVRVIRVAVSEELERVLQQALRKVPADRFATAQEFADALTAGAAATAHHVSGVMTARPAEKSIAVLPFINMSADPENEYFSDGITEEIISALSRLKEFRVAARSSSFAFKGRSADIAEVAARLNVATVLEGSVRKAGNQLRITAQLINAADGYHLWSERYDRELKDVFAIQDELAQAIVRTLKGQLANDEQPQTVRQSTDNIVAYELYLRGRYVEKTRTRDGIAKGIEYFKQAIRESENNAPAYAGLADSYYYQAFYRYSSPRESFPKASDAASKALAIDDSLAEAHASLGAVKFYYDWDWDGADRAFRRAIELNPNHAVGHHWHAECLASMRRPDEALAAVSKAHELDPLSLTVNAGLGWVHYFGRRYDEAIQRFEKTLELDPDYVFLNWFLGQAYLGKGMVEEAVAAFQRGMDRSGGHPGMAAYLGHACARAGKNSEALRLYRELEERAQRTYIPCDYLAVISLGLGRTDEALEWLEKACDERSLHMVFLGVDPLFDDLRGESGFTELLSRIDLERG